VFGGSTEVVVEGKEDLFLFLPWCWFWAKKVGFKKIRNNDR